MVVTPSARAERGVDAAAHMSATLQVTGQGASGFRKMLGERHRAVHARMAQSWRCYVDLKRRQPSVGFPVEIVRFYDFESPEYGGRVPSLAWLIKAFVEDSETRRPFHVRRLQMARGGVFCTRAEGVSTDPQVDGIVLQGDHSHKIAKLVHSGATRAFEGLYTLMNGYGQVVGFWFVHGTTLEELKPMLQGVAWRYKAYGFNGPLLFTTDRCCDERKF